MTSPVEETNDLKGNGEYAVEVINGIKIYDSIGDGQKVSALQGTDLRVKFGEIVSIIGPSGAGKTTLLRVIAGIEPLSSGDVKVGGYSLISWNDALRREFRRKYIGTFTQHGRDNFDPNMKVIDAIKWETLQAGWDVKSATKRANELLEQIGISELKNRPCGQLSAGEAMRVSLLKAIAKKPFIVLADEPSGQLDSENMAQLFEVMQELTKNETAILVATHDIRFQSLSDRTLLIMDGRLASEGDTAGLVEKRLAFLNNKIDDKIIEARATLDSANSIRLSDSIIRRLGINSRLIIKHKLGEDHAIIKPSKDDREVKDRVQNIIRPKIFTRDNVKSNNIIEFNEIFKTYQTLLSKNEVLKDVTFNIKEGELVILLGPSGSGKTTLLNILTGLEKPSSGSIKVMGTDMSRGSGKSKIQLQRMSYLTQNYTVHPYLTVEENAVLPILLRGKNRSKNKEELRKYLEFLEIEEYTSRFPTSLSGGQQQRASLTSSLMKDTEILVADEPTANLDHDLALKVMNLLTDLAEEGKTILIATHDFMLIQPGHRVIRLQNHKILDDKIADDEYCRYLRSQYFK